MPIFKRLARIVPLTLGVLLLLSPASPARAHTDVDEYVPATGDILDVTPAEISLRFSSEVDPSAVEITLQHRDGRPVPLTGDGIQFEDRRASVTPPALDFGTYVVVWKSVGADGHIAVGQSYFSVGQEDAGPILDLRPSAGTSAGVLDVITRWSIYVLLSVATGMFLLGRFGIEATRNLWLQRWLPRSLLVLIPIRLLYVSSRAGGQGGVARGLVRALSSMPSLPGWVLLAAGAVILLRASKNPRLLLPGALLVALGETLTGHMGTATNAGVLVPLTLLHLLGVALWLGGVLAFVLQADSGQLGKFARAFSLPAFLSVAAIALSGIGLTWARTRLSTVSGLLGLLDYDYGRLLGLKWLLLFLAVLPVAGYHAVNSIVQRLAAADDPSLDPSPAGSRRTFLVEALAITGVLILGSALAGLPPVQQSTTSLAAKDLLAAPASFGECLDPSSAADQLLCATRYFEGIVESKGMSAALQEVSARWRDKDPWMQTNCHSIGHKLGRLGYRIYQDIPKAFAAGSDPCDYGYLHGVIEGASAEFSDEDLLQAMTSLCEGTGDPSNHGYRQCIHGLGHAAARRVNNDLARGMDFCRVFHNEISGDPSQTANESTDDVIFRLCVTGVSMEWNTQPKALDAISLPIGAPGTLLGECLKLDEIFYVGCVEYGTSALGGELEREIEARNWCDANLDDPLPCYQSIGRDVIWSPSISDEQAMEVCTGGRGGIYAEQCITRALGSVATIALDASAIDEFCPVVPEQYRYLCPIVRDAMVVQIEQTVRGFIVDSNSTKDQ